MAATPRDALALVLLCQTNGIWLDRINRVPNLEQAKRVMDAIPMLREGIYENADQLIAAYEGAADRDPVSGKDVDERVTEIIGNVVLASGQSAWEDLNIGPRRWGEQAARELREAGLLA